MTDQELLLPKHLPSPIRLVLSIPRRLRSSVPIPSRPAKMNVTTSTPSYTDIKEFMTDISPTDTMDSSASTLVVDSLEIEPASLRVETIASSLDPPLVVAKVANPNATLTAIPSELLIKILAHVPTKSYLPLQQTSHGLRLFINENLISIVNSSIETRFVNEAALMGVTRLAGQDGAPGWLVPTLQALVDAENERLVYRRNICITCRANWMGLGGPATGHIPTHPLLPASLTCTHTVLPLSLLTSGPLFLYFLEENQFKVSWEGYTAANHRTQTIQTRIASSTAHPDPATENTILDAIVDAYFQGRIKPYVLRGFVQRLDELSEAGIAIWEVREGLGVRIKKVWGKIKVRVAEKGVLGLGKRKLSFGEVREERRLARLRERGGQMRLDLLWYFGRTGVLSCPLREEDRLGVAVKEGKVAVLRKKARELMGKAWVKARKAGEKIMGVLRASGDRTTR